MDGYLYISYYGNKLIDCKNLDTFEELEWLIKMKSDIFPFGNRESFKKILKTNKVMRHINELESQFGWYILDLTDDIDYDTKLNKKYSEHLTQLLKVGFRNMRIESLGI